MSGYFLQSGPTPRCPRTHARPDRYGWWSVSSTHSSKPTQLIYAVNELSQLGISSSPGLRTNISFDDTVGFIRRSIQHCQSTHECVPRSRENQSGVPARLVRLKASADAPSAVGGNDVRLIDTVAEYGSFCPPYATLTHCWGTNLPRDIITTQANLSQQMSGISVQSLPLNFQHAIYYAGWLGVQYIWIDALCIVQDLPDDWKAESVKMGAIYSGSVITLAAAWSEDSFGGFTIGQAKLTPFTKTTQLAHGAQRDIIWSHLDEVRGSSPPISTRGWTFQELMLSPRVVYFAKEQVVWQCRQLWQTEDRLLYSGMDKFLGGRLFRGILAARNFGNLLSNPEQMNDADLMWYWEREGGIVRDYTHRDFTKYSDRAIAIAGVAQRLEEVSGVRYVAGLWIDRSRTGDGLDKFHEFSHGGAVLYPTLVADCPQGKLLRGLCWRTEERVFPAKGTARREPSWSWISNDVPILWPQWEGEVPYQVGSAFPRVISYLLLDDGGHSVDSFGLIHSGVLLMDLWLLECEVRVRDDLWAAPDLYHGETVLQPTVGGRTVHFDDLDGPLPPGSHKVFCTVLVEPQRIGILSTLFGLVLVRESETTPSEFPAFRRVGLWHASGQAREVYSENAAQVRIQLW
jgi:hypothetical protein